MILKLFFSLIRYEIFLFVSINSSKFLILRINWWCVWRKELYLKLLSIFLPFSLHSCLAYYVLNYLRVQSVQLSYSVMSDSLQPQGLQHARLPYPSPTPGAYSNSCPSHWWCHPTISSSAIPFSSCLQSFPASGPFEWISSLYQVAKALEFQLQHQSLQWIFRTAFLQDWLVGSPCSPKDPYHSYILSFIYIYHHI